MRELRDLRVLHASAATRWTRSAWPFAWVVLMTLTIGCSRNDAAGQDEESNASRRAPAQRLVVYSGRTEGLIDPLFRRFEAQTGIPVQVRYGETASLAAAILEEGPRSPADVFVAQDASAIGALQGANRLAPLPAPLLERVRPSFRSTEGMWVGISGRARVLTYRPDRVREDELPDTLTDLLHPRWQGRLGWAPTNASFQSMVTALVQLEGADAAERWVRGILALQPRAYPGNSPAVQAVLRGEVDAVLTNHYYLYRLQGEGVSTEQGRNHYLRGGDAGAMINVSAIGRLATSRQSEAAERLIGFLLEEEQQRFFVETNHELPTAQGMHLPTGFPALESLAIPTLRFEDLSDLTQTHHILRRTGAMP